MLPKSYNKIRKYIIDECNKGVVYLETTMCIGGYGCRYVLTIKMLMLV